MPRAGMSYISPLEPELNEGDRCVLVFMTSAVLLYAVGCTLYATLKRILLMIALLRCG